MISKPNKQLLSVLIDSESLYQNAPCGYVSCLDDGTIIKINNTLLIWLGYTEVEVVGILKIGNLLSKGARIYFQMFHYPLILLDGKVNELNYDIYRKDKSYFPSLINSNAVKSPEGNLLAINLVINDITDRKKYETELLKAKEKAEEERGKFEFVSDFIPEMVWTANEKGYINYINKRFEKQFDLKSNQLDKIKDKIHSEDRVNALRSWIKAIKQQNEFQIKLRLKKTSAIYEWYLLKGIPFVESNGEVSKWLGSCLNIHSHVLELEKRDEFLTIASHELKTPITSLKISLQILNRENNDEIPEKYKHLIRQATHSIDKITHLIDNLLDVKQLQNGHLTLNKSYFNVYEMANSCWRLINYQNKFELNLLCDKEVIIFADEYRIEQVVINFLSNAIKYAPSSTHLTLSIIKSKTSVTVSVKDQGDGIAKDKLPHLFERYYQAQQDQSKYAGLGLGLYISAEIMERHGGKIGVESKLGEGSTFWFSLPF